MKNIFPVLLFFLLLIAAAPVRSASMVAGALEPTQYLNYGELYSQTNQSMSQLQTQISQLTSLRQQVAAGRTLDWSMAKTVITDVANTVRASQGIGYDSQVMAARWSGLYPDFNKRSGTDYIKQYSNWSKESNNAIKTGLAVNGQQVGNFQSDAATRAQLETLSNEANGSKSQVDAINATNNIALGQYDEMHKLRQLQTAQNGAMLTYMQGNQQVQDTKAAQDDTLNKMFSKPAETRTYEQLLKLNQ